MSLGMDSDALTVQRLYYFLRASQERSLHRAAESLYLAPSALTTHINALEMALGVQLFVRSKTGITLTSSGRQLVPYAERVLQKMSRLAEFADGLATGREATLSIACYPVHVERYLGTVIGRFLNRNPAIHLDLTQMRDDRRRNSGRSLFDELLDFEVDLAMGPPHTHLGGIDGFEAFVARIVALVPDDHPFRESTEIPIEALDGERVLVAPPGYFSRMRLESEARAANVSLLVGAQSSSPPALMVLGKAGLGIPVLPDDYPLVGQHAVPYPTVVNAEGEEIKTPVWLQWRAGEEDSPFISPFLEISREVTLEEKENGRFRQDYYHLQVPEERALEARQKEDEHAE